MKNTICIITGHPRSGTSFTASLLQSAGLSIGQKLMAPGHGNVRGFFEDLDVVGLHEAILRANDIHHVGWTLEKTIPVDSLFRDKAKKLIAQNAGCSIWGWKDPRTTLFLRFWKQLLPDANFLFLYRAPWEVVDSIYRRGDDMFQAEPELAIKIWMHYNQKLLDFYDEFPDCCFVASVYNVSGHSAQFIQLLNQKFKINLEEPAESLYEKALLHTQVSDWHYPDLIQKNYPEAIEIYRQLNKREKQNGLAPDQIWQQNINSAPNHSGAFQDWSHIRQLERKVKNLQAELEIAQSQITVLQNENRMIA